MARGKKKSKLKVKLFSILAVIIVAIGVGTFVGLPNVEASDEKTVELPPLSFAGGTSDNENGAVFAKVKQTTWIIDSNSNILIGDESTGIEGNPLLAFTDPSTGRTVAGAVVIPKIWFDYPTAFKPSITLDTSTLQLVVQSQLPNGNWKQTVTKSIQTFGNVEFNSGDQEIPLASFGIDGDEIYEDLPDGSYDTLQRFSVSGNLHMHYTDFPHVKMTIPIGVNDLKSWYTARVTQDPGSLFIDSDGDRILDQHDDCPNQKETFNGYQDGDGCPDTAPTNTPDQETNPDPDPITDEQQCESDGRLWVNGVCVDKSSGTLTLSEPPFAVVAVVTNYLDGSKSHRAYTSDSDGRFDFLLNSLLDENNGQTKSIGSIVYNTYLGSFTDSLQGYKIATSDLKYKGTVDIASKSLNVGTKNGAGGSTSEAKSLTLFDHDTSISFTGVSISQATFTSVDIHNAINNFDGIELVPEGSERNLDFLVDISGTVTLTGSSGSASGTIPLTLSDASISHSGFTLKNAVAPKTGGNAYGSFNDASVACGGDDKVKAIGGGEYACTGSGTGPTTGTLTCPDGEYLVVIDSTQTCIKKGATTNQPNPSIPGGDDICIDADNPGGFPCGEEYKSLWCNGTTQCEVPPSSSNDGDTGSGSGVGGDSDGDSCTDNKGFQPNSIADDICINGDSNSNDQSGNPGDFCTSAQSCIEKQFNIDLNDPLTLGVIIIGGIVVLGSYLKKDSRYSPIPASTTQFSR